MADAGTKTENSLKVVFVCMANSCRSQIAEGLARKWAPHWDVYSAGLLPAGYVTPHAITVMREIGIDISGHRSKGLDEVNLDAMHVVVAMGGFPASDFVAQPEGKVIENWEIADPVGHGTEFFKQVRDHIGVKIRELAAQLAENA